MSQLKIKNGNNWESIPASGIGVPSGGTQGQVLTKSSSTDYATEWAEVTSVFDELYPATNKNNGAATLTLAHSIEDYDYILFCVKQAYVDGYGAWEYRVIPRPLYGDLLSASWFATDSTSWYIVVMLQLSGSTCDITQFTRAGYGGSAIKIYGHRG